MLSFATGLLRRRCLAEVDQLLARLDRALGDSTRLLDGRIELDVLGTRYARQFGAPRADARATFTLGHRAAFELIDALQRRRGAPLRRARRSGDDALAQRFLWLLGEAAEGEGGLSEARYRRIARAVPGAGPVHMNCGYVDPGQPSSATAGLAAEDAPYRYSIELIRRLLRDDDVAGQRVLEVGSGRGGVSAALHRYCGAGEVVGLELDPGQVEIARRTWTNLDKVQFVAGDAQRMPFADGTFAMVVSVDSHHDYPKKLSFLKEALRVLQPGGRFLLADNFVSARSALHVPLYRDALRHAGFEGAVYEDLPSAHVAEAMRRGRPELEAVLRRTMPAPFERWAYLRLLSQLKRDYASGRLSLRSFRARRPGSLPPTASGEGASR